MSLKHFYKYVKIRNRNKDTQPVLKLKEVYSECSELSIKYKRDKWISFYDIETVFQSIFIDPELSDITLEILILLQLSIEKIQKKFKSKEMPLKALKVLIDSSIKSVVIK